MNNSISITPRRLLVIGLFGLLAVLSYGFAAANTVPDSAAGDGQGAISGYTVSDVHYVLDVNNPANATSVTFTVAPGIPAGGAARVALAGPTAWLPSNACTFTPGVATSPVTCTGTVAVTALTNLRVVAAQ